MNGIVAIPVLVAIIRIANDKKYLVFGLMERYLIL
jgi:hypothetical protein